ncbi:MAG: archaellin/type IV pilin N-terminal domain-containing protein [Candidatus Bathyarchaeia archaeon]
MNGILRHNRKAISPVIATIIIVAVAIVMSIAVAYWMLGLATTFTRYEKLEFVSAYATYNSAENAYFINMTVKNTGSSPATVKMFLLNGIPHTDLASNNITIYNYNYTNNKWEKIYPSGEIDVPVNPGSEVKFSVQLEKEMNIGSGIVTSGVTLEITIQTAAGNQYPKTVVLP